MEKLDYIDGLVVLPNITKVVSEGRKTIKVGEDALVGDGNHTTHLYLTGKLLRQELNRRC